LPTFTFAALFPVGKQACGPGARALREKSIGPVISGFQLLDFCFSIRIPQSAFRNLEAGPPGVTEFGIFISFFHSAFRI
jgi:hypothetical protein